MNDSAKPPAIRPATAVTEGEPPLVARLVVEIRSDGSRTIARGALEDATTGERTTMEARGGTPLSLLLSLSRAVAHLPTFARRAAWALMPERPPRR